MKQYLDLIQDILDNGEWTENRTGVKTKMLPGAMMRFDLSKGFPAVTTKKLAFKAVVGELCAFLRASRSAADFRALGCKVWDQNANENQQWLANPFRKGADDLGPVYGVQWREWPGFKLVDRNNSGQMAAVEAAGWEYEVDCGAGVDLYSKDIDQLGDCVRTIINNPDNRRILFHGWNPAVLDEVALPACHLLYQFMPNKTTGKLHMNMYQRSADNGLGTPFNIAEAAVLMSLIARLTGYEPGLLSIFHGDSHVYENHLDMVGEQLKRVPYQLPQLMIDSRVPFSADAETAVAWLKLVEPSDFKLVNYVHHEPLTAPMAV